MKCKVRFEQFMSEIDVMTALRISTESLPFWGLDLLILALESYDSSFCLCGKDLGRKDN